MPAIHQLPQAAGILRLDLGRGTELHEPAQRVAGQLAKQAALGTGKSPGIRHGGATFGPNEGKWPGGLRSRAEDAVPVPLTQGIDRRGCAAETPLAVTFAAGTVGDGLSSLVNQRPADADEQGMTASVVPIARAMSGRWPPRLRRLRPAPSGTRCWAWR